MPNFEGAIDIRKLELRVLDARVTSLADLASFYHSVSVAGLAPVCSACKTKTINETLLNDILTGLIAHIRRLELRINTLEQYEKEDPCLDIRSNY